MSDGVAAGTGSLADEVFARALLRGTFTLRSGATSDRYFDKWRVTADPVLLRTVAGALAARLPAGGSITGLVAPELGAVPLVVAMSLATGLPYAVVRGSGKRYGTGNRVEGLVGVGSRAVLVEDVVTSGGAALEALAAARAAGVEVDRSLCVLCRDPRGSRALAEAGAPLVALLDHEDLDRAVASGAGTWVGEATAATGAAR